ncbi:Rrf2 family transcriptional regulator [Candidatus Sumerlaeota bacterium]|nr:Rrf2 family transcriptional regulator [Candidatus Sumerlaeota bacterium]
MSNILRVSEAASLAIHASLIMAGSAGESVGNRQMATLMGASEAHLAKVLQRLARVGLVKSARGPKGGFVLAKAPTDITILEIYEAIEGPLGAVTCLLGRPVCGGGDKCFMGDLLHDLGGRIKAHMGRMKLSALVANGWGKDAVSPKNRS